MFFAVLVLLDFKSQLLSKYIFYYLLRNQQIPLQLGLQHFLEVFDGLLRNNLNCFDLELLCLLDY